MKNILAILTILSSSSAFAVDWAQPKIACLESLMPQGYPCLDLSQVKNPLTDFPTTISADEKKLWSIDRANDLALCRSEEVLKRAKINPSQFTAWQVEYAWMRVNGAEEKESKLKSIHHAAAENNMPSNILFGALTQESLLANLGITPDGDNYSCGMSQINIQEFCRGISTLSDDDKKSLGWPDVKCDEANLPTTIVKPLYNLAVKNNPGPDYLHTAKDYSVITYNQVKESFQNEKQFQAAKAFTTLCQDIKLSIKFKAIELKRLYNMVPEGLRKIEHYQEGDGYHSVCNNPYTVSVYPLQTAWLLAVAMYNAGPNEIKLIQHYNQMTKQSNDDGSAWENFTPVDLVEALHWGGKWKEGTTSVAFKDLDGKEYTQRWYKSCVVQRHVARVVQHVTMKGQSILNSIEQAPCEKDVIPEYRKVSSGIKE